MPLFNHYKADSFLPIGKPPPAIMAAFSTDGPWKTSGSYP